MWPKRLARWRPSLSEFEFDVVNCSVGKHQEANTLSQLPTDGSDNASLEDKLPILVIGSGGKMDDKTITIFLLQAYSSSHAQPATNSDQTDARPLTFADITASQSANDFCQNASCHHCQV